jgi:hypothetical protein
MLNNLIQCRLIIKYRQVQFLNVTLNETIKSTNRRKGNEKIYQDNFYAEIICTCSK